MKCIAPMAWIAAHGGRFGAWTWTWVLSRIVWAVPVGLVVKRTFEAFQGSASRPLAERLLLALEAGGAVGGEELLPVRRAPGLAGGCRGGLGGRRLAAVAAAASAARSRRRVRCCSSHATARSRSPAAAASQASA